MIKKPHKPPLKMQILEAVVRRLPEDHPIYPKAVEELQIVKAGYVGEKAIDYHLSYLDEEDYTILHDLRLQDKDYFFQLDTLIISSHFIVILEVKNIAGTLFFDHTFNQLIRTLDEKETGFRYPLTQLDRQKGHLINWLKQKKLSSDIPILTFVVISNPKTIVKSSTRAPEYTKRILHSEQLPSTISQIKRKQQSENPLTKKDIQRFTRKLIQSHSVKKPPIIDQLHLNKSDFITGFHCPKCQAVPINKRKHKWECPSCGNSTTIVGLVDSLKDFGLLLHPTITNSQFRAFFHIQSIYTAWHMLKAMKLPYTGDKKGRVYEIPINDN